MDFAFTPEQEELRSSAGAFLAANPDPSWQRVAELGWTGASVAPGLGGSGLGFVEEGILFEETGRALLHAPFYSTVALVLPALDDELRSEVARGAASWTFAPGRLVPDLDTAERVAVLHDDGIYELEGFDREILETIDETRPPGVVSGGRRWRRLAGIELLPQNRCRCHVSPSRGACRACCT